MMHIMTVLSRVIFRLFEGLHVQKFLEVVEPINKPLVVVVRTDSPAIFPIGVDGVVQTSDEVCEGYEIDG